MIIFFIRHGETIWNKKRILQGHKDSPLTPKGKISAQKFGERLKKENIEKIYSSDLGRCVQTAEIINRFLNVKLIKTAELRERNFGNLNGLSNKEVAKQINLLDADKKAPNGESFNELKKRIITFIRSLSNRKSRKILLITHDGPTKAILSEYHQINVNSAKCKTSDSIIYRLEAVRNKILKGSLRLITVK